MKIVKIILILFAIIVTGGFVQANNIYFFWGEGCPYCEKQKEHLKELQNEYDFDIKDYEVYNHPENQKIMEKFEKGYNATFNGVPVTVIGKDYVIGARTQKTKSLIKEYSQKDNYKDPYEYIYGEQKNKDNGNKKDEERKITKEFLGYEISMQNIGWIPFGIILGVIDGINPCVLGVLVFLLTYLVSIGSRKKLLIAGIIFTATTFLFYFLAMLLIHHALFSVNAIMPYISSVKIGIGVLGILLGGLALKDYLGYDWGPSLGIPKKVKPTIMYIAQKGTYVSAFVLAVFASLVELPCTIGIPLMYVGALGKEMNIIGALLLYNAFYVIPVLLVILGIYLGFSKIKSGKKEIGIAKEENRRWMKLLAGVVLIILGAMFVLGII